MYIMRKVAQRNAGMGLKLLKFHMMGRHSSVRCSPPWIQHISQWKYAQAGKASFKDDIKSPWHVQFPDGHMSLRIQVIGPSFGGNWQW
jgi:hypothetical protein